MSEPPKKRKKKKEKKTEVGKTFTMSFGVSAILMRLDPEAKRILDKLPKDVQHLVRERAIELSKEKGRDYDVRLEDVVEAKKELESKKSEGKV